MKTIALAALLLLAGFGAQPNLNPLDLHKPRPETARSCQPKAGYKRAVPISDAGHPDRLSCMATGKPLCGVANRYRLGQHPSTLPAPKPTCAGQHGSRFEISHSQAIRALIGECGGGTYREMVAVGCALRNRKTLVGVYGLRAKWRIDHAPERVKAMARRAWAESARRDITGGANHWESARHKKPYWTKGMAETARIGSFSFWRGK